MNIPLLYQWTQQLASHFPSLNPWQVKQLALFSDGVIQAESCQQGQVARQVSQTTQVERSARRFRRYLHNRQWALSNWCAEWTQWVVSGLQTTQVTLRVDETKLGQHLGVMMVGGGVASVSAQCLPARRPGGYDYTLAPTGAGRAAPLDDGAHLGRPRHRLLARLVPRRGSPRLA